MNTYTMRWSLGHLDTPERCVTVICEAISPARAESIGSIESLKLFKHKFGETARILGKARIMQQITATSETKKEAEVKKPTKNPNDYMTAILMVVAGIRLKKLDAFTGSEMIVELFPDKQLQRIIGDIIDMKRRVINAS